jgi:hypothetical protein
MHALSKLWSLSRADKLLLVEAACWAALYRVALWVLPYRLLHRAASRRTVSTASGLQRPVPLRVAWAVEVAGRRVPKSTCLVRALAGQRMMARHGYQSALRIGVEHPAAGFAAHAWLEYEGQVILGGPGTGRFTPLPL